MEANKIPHIQIEKFSTGKYSQSAIKGFVKLPCWTGYFLVEKPHHLIKTRVVTDGKIDLWIDGEIRADNTFHIDKEQTDAYLFLVNNQEQIKKAILQELKYKLPGLLTDEYASWDHDKGGFPVIAELTPEFDFKNYIGPASISIEEDVKDNVAYIKWRFECTWDPEHGFEVITHQDRVIDLSPEADIFKINMDNGTYQELEKEMKHTLWKKPIQKKWWQIWKK